MYTITITRTGMQKGLITKQWQVMGRAADGKVEYGYTPEVEGMKAFEYKMYEQVVEELDLPAVIRAVNGMDS